MGFESEFEILNSNENTVNFHLSSICLQMPLTEITSKNYAWAKSDTLFNQRQNGNQLGTGNNCTTFNTTDWWIFNVNMIGYVILRVRLRAIKTQTQKYSPK